MREIFDKFTIRFIPESIQRVQMDDATYFSSEYADYISNSKLGLLNPVQGGSPQKFLEGFKSSGSNAAFTLGSAVHQLTLESNDYILSPLIKPSGKLGLIHDYLIEELSKSEGLDIAVQICSGGENGYDNFIKLMDANKDIERCVLNAFTRADYYTSEIEKYSGDDYPSRMRTALLKIMPYFSAHKPNTNKEGKKYIYLSNDQHAKCINCTNSLKSNTGIQKALNWENSYCEDVILAEVEVTFPEDFNNEFSEMVSTIMKVKIKIDNWTIDHDEKKLVLNDLKTTGKPIQYFMGHEELELGFMGSQNKVFIPGSWQKFHYHRQMGMYLCFLKKYVDKEFGEGYKCAANMLVVETCGAQAAGIFNVSQPDIIAGFNDFVQLLKRAAYHQVNGYEQILEFAITKETEFNLDI